MSKSCRLLLTCIILVTTTLVSNGQRRSSRNSPNLKAANLNLAEVQKDSSLWNVYLAQTYTFGRRKGNVLLPVLRKANSLWYLYDLTEKEFIDVPFTSIIDFFQSDTITSIFGTRKINDENVFGMTRVVDDNTQLRFLDTKEVAGELFGTFDDDGAVVAAIKSGVDTVIRYVKYDHTEYSPGPGTRSHILYPHKKDELYRVFDRSTQQNLLFANAQDVSPLGSYKKVIGSAWGITLGETDGKFYFVKAGMPIVEFTNAQPFTSYSEFTSAARNNVWYVIDRNLKAMPVAAANPIDSIALFDAPGTNVLIRTSAGVEANCAAKKIWEFKKIENDQLVASGASVCSYHLIALDSDYVLRQSEKGDIISLYNFSTGNLILEVAKGPYDLKKARVTTLTLEGSRRGKRARHYYLLNIWNTQLEGYEQFIFDSDKADKFPDNSLALYFKINAECPFIYSFAGKKDLRWKWVDVEKVYRQWRSSNYKDNIRDLVTKAVVCSNCNITRLNAFVEVGGQHYLATGSIPQKNNEDSKDHLVVVDANGNILNQ